MLATTGKVLLSMATSLLTEKFIKKLVIQLLEFVVERTATEADNKLLAEAKKEWEKD